MSDEVYSAIARELGDGFPPEDVLYPVNARLRKSYPNGLTIEDIVNVFLDEDATAVRTALRARLRQWDAESAASWVGFTTPNTDDRRAMIYDLLGIPAEGHAALDEVYARDGGPVVIAAPQPWAPWYTPERRNEHNFYWRAYRRVLEGKSWDDETIGKLDVATTEVVQRLADPSRPEPYQSKGLVVGYVQSGKTANFSGVVAKSIDAGYRLIIVLTGTIEILRSQTQRRLDMELVGRQNISAGVDDDYAHDEDWLRGRFLEHEVDPNKTHDVPAIRRLTTSTFDYKSLLAGLSALHFEISDHALPLHDPKNLHTSNVRIAVIKKNVTSLKKLVADLKKVPTELDQIPALIIDDEADQASVNTIDPKKAASLDQIERTAINAQIAEILGLLKRAQYVGYTATPFANVFVDPDDSVNVFPSDFIVSLERPGPYMGGADFHDFEDEFDDAERTPANSNEKAYVRDLRADSDEERTAEQLCALDSYVLAGAIKLFRESRGASPFRHHTMLVHESVKQAEHEAVADEFKALWTSAGYSQPSSLARLEKLWIDDFAPVSLARAEAGSAIPKSFEEIEPFIGAAYDKISEGTSPVIIVNGAAEKDYTQDSLDFQERGVWKILVGGTKLSRGFTVEGLTTTYYTRRTGQADTLMQMGRWFGFRPGYRDLVRLFIGRSVPGAAGADFDMYKAFEAVVRDEEEFRAELARFKGTNAQGEPWVTPRDVPPMVFQQLPWLRPTARNKMFNAEQTYRGIGGESFSFTMQPPRGDGSNNVRHFNAVRPLLHSLTETGSFEFADKDGRRRSFSARHGIVPASVVLEAVDQFVWDRKWDFGPHREALVSAMDRGLLDDFAILLPLPKTRLPVDIKGWPEQLPIVNRKRQEREYRTGFTGTAVRERDAIEHIAGSPDKNGGTQAQKLHRRTRGALILVFASDPEAGSRQMKRAKTGPVDPSDFATLFSYALPYAAEPLGRIGFRVKKSGAGAIVDAQ
ncbi:MULTISPECIES: Z1 domain-containing protein [unclassified Rhodococcus (in: high G+C Gram-positive bacteria)]|uniref:Z1 domain-containing protein n=1 Tax=unclassified Rhodococcus (in: high G+C Gram-positive bacteria) TaxID=192944 RepID=UPI001320330E|nr:MULTISPECIES: Z1 domain-containing protein [unclassified Rhodococcus (in: high G+C Gram-positive bacteria)]QHE68597.1 putative endonuclease [Rhodococcus sp. WAY2]